MSKINSFIDYASDILGDTDKGISTSQIISICNRFAAEYNVNIIDITQSVLQDMFVMVMLTDIKGLKSQFKDFSDAMDNLGKELNLEIRVMHEDIFNSMHRI